MKTINLKEILELTCIDENKVNISNKAFILAAMKEACKQTLELAAKNAKYDGGGCFNNGEHLESVPIKINKQSIINIINQVE